jgi:hypothetical protein
MAPEESGRVIGMEKQETEVEDQTGDTTVMEQ